MDVAGLRKLHAEAKSWLPAELAGSSPLSAGVKPLPRFFAARRPTSAAPASVIAALNAEGYWPSPLGNNSHVYRRDGSKTPAPGDYSQTAVGDDSDTSPFPDPMLVGISTEAYIRNMSALIRALDSPAPIETRPATVWQVDSLERIGGHPVTVLGSPRVVAIPAGKAVEFDGVDDGLVLDVNAIAGLGRFTVEVVFEPAVDGAEEQRFLHFEEAETGNRALVELRLLPGPAWCLDTFLRHGDASLTLIDKAVVHQAGRWHAAALSFDGKTMTHYVNGVRESSGEVAFKPLGPGQTSIGVRLNKRSWFKGRIRTIRITPDALTPPPAPHSPPAERHSSHAEWLSEPPVDPRTRGSALSSVSGARVLPAPGGITAPPGGRTEDRISGCPSRHHGRLRSATRAWSLPPRRSSPASRRRPAQAGPLAGRPKHAMTITVDPATHVLTVTDRVQLPNRPADGVVEFVLNAALRVTRSEPAVREVPLGADARVLRHQRHRRGDRAPGRGEALPRRRCPRARPR